MDLPHPVLLDRLHLLEPEVTYAGFELDVSNMFYQLVLPRWLSLLLPRSKVHFGDLSEVGQRALLRRLG